MECRGKKEGEEGERKEGGRRKGGWRKKKGDEPPKGQIVDSPLPAIILFLVFSAVAVGAVRPLAGEELSGQATAGESIVRFLRQIYRQRLNGPGHSCQTWNPNGRC